MGLTTGITWADATWNPWQGCTKVSPACTNCYMFRDLNRYGRDPNVVTRSKPPTFNLPLKRKHGKDFAIAPGMKVFTCSWSDWFHVDADPWRDEAWAIIRQRPDVIFQVVTKRVERIADHLPADWGNGYPNVWMIATVENQEWADRRIPQLVSVPAAVHGLSVEPLLGELDLTQFTGIDWVILGGESGPGARPMEPRWARTVRDQCESWDIPFFFKQWGDWVPDGSGGMVKASHTDTGNNIIDGSIWEQFPISEIAA